MAYKKDCFGFKDCKPPCCKILTELVCGYKDTCSFYKSKQQFRDDLIRIHGTDDMKRIMRQVNEAAEAKRACGAK